MLKHIIYIGTNSYFFFPSYSQIFESCDEKIFRSAPTENVGHLLEHTEFHDTQPYTESSTSSLVFFGDTVLPTKDLMNNQVRNGHRAPTQGSLKFSIHKYFNDVTGDSASKRTTNVRSSRS